MAAPRANRRVRGKKKPDLEKIADRTREIANEELEAEKKSFENVLAGLATSQKEQQVTGNTISEQSPDIVSEPIETKQTGITEEPIMAKTFDEEIQEPVNSDSGEISNTDDEIIGDRTVTEEDIQNPVDLLDKDLDFDEAPSIEDDVDEGKINVEDKSKDIKSEESKKGKATAGYADLTNLIKSNVRAARLVEKGAQVETILKENVFIKLFVTTNNFGRSIVYSNVGKSAKEGEDKNANKHGEFRISVNKPGRAKSLVVTMPKAFQDSLTSRSQASTVTSSILAKSAEVDDVQDKEMVDVVVNYNDFSMYIATLMGGRIAEFGNATNGPLSYDNKKNNKNGDGIVDTPADITELVGGENHVFYFMKRPDSALSANVLNADKEGTTLESDDVKALDRYYSGKVPLKRASKSASPLYTPKNFVSTIKYDTVNPFVSGVTDADMLSISAKASFQCQKDGACAPLHADDKVIREALEAGKPVPMFDQKTGSAEERYSNLIRAERDHIGMDGKPETENHYISKAEYEANPDKYADSLVDGKNRHYYKVPKKKGVENILTRTPRDFFTGEYMSGNSDIQFIKFTDKILSKNDKYIAPKALRYVVKIEGVNTNAEDRDEVVGSFGLDDPAFDNARNVGIDNSLLAQAIKSATTTVRKGGVGSDAQNYRPGELSAIMAMYQR